MSNETQTATGECSDPHCDNIYLPTDMAIIRDESGALYCDALCHHAHEFGVRPPITMTEQASYDRAWGWIARHRPEHVCLSSVVLALEK